MKIAVAIAILFSLAPAALADTIIADATGADSSNTTDFWGVNFTDGDGYVKSVTFDLTADNNAYFDFDGVFTYGNAKKPILGTLIGLNSADITFSTSGAIGGYASHPSSLTFSFATGSFGAGDSFRFSADTDALGIGVPDSGVTMADSGVIFSVLLEDGFQRSAVFEAINDDAALAVVHSAEPSSWALTLLALGIIVWRARRRPARVT